MNVAARLLTRLGWSLGSYAWRFEPDCELFRVAVRLVVDAVLPDSKVDANGRALAESMHAIGTATPAMEAVGLQLVLRSLEWCGCGFDYHVLLAAFERVDQTLAMRELPEPQDSMVCVSAELAANAAERVDAGAREVTETNLSITKAREAIRAKLAIIGKSVQRLSIAITDQELSWAGLVTCVAQHEVLCFLGDKAGVEHYALPTRPALQKHLDFFSMPLKQLLEQRQFILAVRDCGVGCAALTDAVEIFNGLRADALAASVPASLQQWSPARMIAAWHAAEAWLEPLLQHRLFLLYFVDQNSILFQHFLSAKMQRPRGSEAPSSADFASDVLDSVRHTLKTLLSATAANFNNMKEAGDKLSRAKRSPSDELKIILDFFGNDASGDCLRTDSELDTPGAEFDLQQAVTGLRSVLQLGQLSTPLLCFTAALQQYSFTCVADEQFRQLELIATMLNDPEQMASRAVSDCIVSRASIHHLLDGAVGEGARVDDDQHEECYGLLLLFANLSDANDVWRFVLERGYFGPDGLSNFSSKLDLITNQGADEQLLNLLDPVVRFVATLVSAKTASTMAEMVAAVRGDARIMTEARRADAHRFQALISVQSHMTRLASWFERGLGGLDAAFAQFKSILRDGSYYHFLLASAQVQLRYTEMDEVMRLDGDALADFVQVSARAPRAARARIASAVRASPCAPKPALTLSSTPVNCAAHWLRAK